MSSTDPQVLDAIVKAYDIRGTVPDQLNAEVAHALGVAFARFAGAPRVLVGRDMRPSGLELVAAFVRGVLEQGVDVVDLGLASTDLVYFAAGTLDAPGAMFTASHNPAQYNGVKLCLAGARAGRRGHRPGRRQGRGRGGARRPRPAPASSAGSPTSRDLLDAFADHVVSFIDPAPMRPLRVVADTANGMGGLVVPAVFERLPQVELEVMYGELDGTFPNHPADPIQPANQRDLQARVRRRRRSTSASPSTATPTACSSSTRPAAACQRLDHHGDARRRRCCAKHPGATILHNLICSRAVPEVVREHGGIPVRTKVGHSFIKQIMAETGAVFGGEHSAHYYFRDNYRADSGIIATMLVLEQLSRADAALSALRKPFERYVVERRDQHRRSPTRWR